MKCVAGVCIGCFSNMKVVCSFETFGCVILPTVLPNVSDDQIHQHQCCGNIKSHVNKICFCVVGLSMIACSCY